MNYLILIGLIMISSGFISIILTMIMVRLIVAKYDILLKKNNLPLPENFALTLPDSWGRVFAYSIYILFYNNTSPSSSSKRYRKFQHIYGKLNFKQYASNVDIILSISNFLLLLIFFLGLFLIVLNY